MTNTTVQNLVQDSGSPEWFTPSNIIEAARSTMGSIDLDPASCAQANKTVQAEQYLTVKVDGLKAMWFGNIFLNHPYGRDNNKRWITKLIRSYQMGHVQQACALVFASTSEGWFQPLFDYPICFIRGRVRHGSPDGANPKASTKGSAVIYLGPHHDLFSKYFCPLGRIMVPYQAGA